jgi:hypothetical protein
MAALVHQRCHHHARREAVARCPACSRHFCRECIVEHAERVLCASCLQRLEAARPTRRWHLAPWLLVAAAVTGLALVWLGFFVVGQILLALPTEFHEGTVWIK